MLGESNDEPSAYDGESRAGPGGNRWHGLTTGGRAANTSYGETEYAARRQATPSDRWPAAAFPSGRVSQGPGQDNLNRHDGSREATPVPHDAHYSIARSPGSAAISAVSRNRAELVAAATETGDEHDARIRSDGRESRAGTSPDAADRTTAVGPAYPSTDPATYMYIPGGFHEIRQALRHGRYQSREARVPGAQSEAAAESRNARQLWPDTPATRGVYR
jgi:hypothetical protein